MRKQIDISNASTVEDLQNLLEGLDPKMPILIEQNQGGKSIEGIGVKQVMKSAKNWSKRFWFADRAKTTAYIIQ